VSSELKTNKVSPATGTAFTLGDSGDTFTLPSGGTLTVASGATIANSGTATGFGKVLQVVSTTKTDANVYSSVSGFSDPSNNSLSITPSSTSSKVLIQVMVNGSSTYDGALRLMRDSTAIGIGTGSTSQNATAFMTDRNVSSYEGFSTTMVFLDSPSTTSSTTYKWQIGGTGSTTWYLNRSASSATTERTVCTITLMEIGA